MNKYIEIAIIVSCTIMVANGFKRMSANLRAYHVDSKARFNTIYGYIMLVLGVVGLVKTAINLYSGV